MKNKSILSVLFVLLSFSQILGQGPYYLRVGFTSPTSTLNWTDDPTGAGGTSPADFSITTTWNLYNTASFSLSPIITLSGVWDLSASLTSTINLGDNTQAAELVINGGTILLGGSTSKLNIQNNATVTIQGAATLPNSKTHPLTGSTFIFAAASFVIPAMASSYKNVIIRESGSLGASITCTNNLTIDHTHTLSINNQTLIVGKFQGDGMIAGNDTVTGTSAIEVRGSGGRMNIAKDQGFFLGLTLDGVSDDLFLGPDTQSTYGPLIIHSGQLNLEARALKLNGQTLKLIDLTGLGFNNSGGKIGGNRAKVGYRYGDLQIINSPITGTVEFDGALLSSLTMSSTGNTFNFSSTGDLQILDSLSVLAGNLNTGGQIIIKSGYEKKGRLARVGGTINGNIKVETHLYGGATGWALIGAPGVSGSTVKAWDTWYSSNKNNGMPMVCNGCDYGPNIFNPPWHSIYTWDEITDQHITSSATDVLAVGKGFWAYVGDKPGITSDLTLLNSGAPVIGMQNINTTQTLSDTAYQGDNLIANPYASPVSWTRVYNHIGTSNNTNYAAAIHVYRANGTWASYVAGGGGNNNGLTDVIPTGQGFYVEQISGTSASLVFNETDKIHDNTTQVLKPSSGPQDYIKLHLTGPAGEEDETTIRFHANATMGRDYALDAKKMFGSPGYAGTAHPYHNYTTISSKDLSGLDYAINAVPPLTQNVTLPVMVHVKASGSYTIRASEIKHLSNCLTLIDKALNVQHDLKSGDYVAQINDTTKAPRFELLMCQDAKVNPVGIQKNPLENNVVIGQDAEGVFVNTMFDQNTKATISAYNVVGQKIMVDIHSVGTVNYRRLPIDVQNQIVIIKVISDQGTVTKKIIKN